MKKWLLNSTLVCLWMGFVFFSCEDGTNRGKSSVNQPDSALKNHSSRGNPVSSQQSNTTNTGRDTIILNKKAIFNNAPDQSRIDSIKAEKTKKKR